MCECVGMVTELYGGPIYKQFASLWLLSYICFVFCMYFIFYCMLCFYMYIYNVRFFVIDMFSKLSHLKSHAQCALLKKNEENILEGRIKRFWEGIPQKFNITEFRFMLTF